MKSMKLLNLGCGKRIHTEWTNVDLVADRPGVIAHDICRGLPFDDDSYDAVYLSHLLEHLTPGKASELVGECRRVLVPGGTLRIVVPDLEAIAREYLSAIDRASANTPGALDDHRWMVVEMLDQLVRTRSGGTMAELFRDESLANHPFVERRMGVEMAAMADRTRRTVGRTALRRIRREIKRLAVRCRRTVVLGLLRLAEGRRGAQAYSEALFRQSGEVHRWMYDRISLAELVGELGYVNARVCGAEESDIAHFADYQLDSVDGRVLKPDSIFIEATKPALAGRKGLAA